MKFTLKRVLFSLILSFVAIAPIFAADIPATYDNPILTGFHPDPSICRKGDDFYLVNSSFEWFPGIPIHKSRDLVNWELVGYAMSEVERCPMQKINTFAPTIRYHDNLFYIIVTCPGAGGNFYITAEDPAGEWSAPTMLRDAPGIDPSLFWDDDGRCYYIGHDHAKPRAWTGHNHIWMQELDLKQGKLIGERKNLTTGHASNAMWTEGPHLYKIDGKYILLVAEGGTSYYHAVTIFHSDTLWGEYIPDHANPILTHRHLGESYPIHSVGHADFVDTPNGEWWMVALGKRNKDGYTYLARETFLVPIKLERREASTKEERGSYNTIIANEGFGKVPDSHTRPNLPWTPVPEIEARDDFDGDKLALRWNLRGVPTSKWHSVEGGHLTINLRSERLSSQWCNPSIVAQRVRDYAFEATTKMSFKSEKSCEQAGLLLYRNYDSYAVLTQKGGDIVLESSVLGDYKELFRAQHKGGDMVLKLVSDGKDVTFYYGRSERQLQRIEPTVPLSIIADLHPTIYNGVMVGVYGSSNGEPSVAKASFDWFTLSYIIQ